MSGCCDDIKAFIYDSLTKYRGNMSSRFTKNHSEANVREG